MFWSCIVKLIGPNDADGNPRRLWIWAGSEGIKMISVDTGQGDPWGEGADLVFNVPAWEIERWRAWRQALIDDIDKEGAA